MKKVVLITGASAGMGKTTAQLLASQGYTVYGAARRIDRMADFPALGITPLAMDVTDEGSMLQGVTQILEHEGQIDALINNAGFGSYGALEDVPLADARYQMEVNVFGAARLTQLVLPTMRTRQKGKIVNVSSIGGKFSLPFGGWYHASKFALEALSDALRNEVKPFGIDVIVIEPGGVKSEWAEIAFEHLLARSQNSPYRSRVEKLAQGITATVEKNADPLIIAKMIQHSLETPRPKLRYVGGHMAHSAVIARKLLPDNWFDALIMRQFQ